MQSNISLVFACVGFGTLCLAIAYRLFKGTNKIVEDAADILVFDENNYYFTYGTDERYPYQLGWTRVIAPSYEAAIAAFKSYHPNREDSNLINCASIYTERQFYATSLPFEGNGGMYEHEYIRINRQSKRAEGS